MKLLKDLDLMVMLSSLPEIKLNILIKKSALLPLLMDIKLASAI